jgi:hypothetical protein
MGGCVFIKIILNVSAFSAFIAVSQNEAGIETMV